MKKPSSYGLSYEKVRHEAYICFCVTDCTRVSPIAGHCDNEAAILGIFFSGIGKRLYGSFINGIFLHPMMCASRSKRLKKRIIQRMRWIYSHVSRFQPL